MTDPTPTPPAHHLGITLDGDVKERIMGMDLGHQHFHQTFATIFPDLAALVPSELRVLAEALEAKMLATGPKHITLVHFNQHGIKVDLSVDET